MLGGRGLKWPRVRLDCSAIGEDCCSETLVATCQNTRCYNPSEETCSVTGVIIVKTNLACDVRVKLQ
jgi:hypothetical protein